MAFEPMLILPGEKLSLKVLYYLTKLNREIELLAGHTWHASLAQSRFVSNFDASGFWFASKKMDSCAPFQRRVCYVCLIQASCIWLMSID